MAGDNGNLVEGNYIGTDPTGTIAIGNGVGDSDVELQGAIDDTIGGTTAAARNIISGDDVPAGSPWEPACDSTTSSKATISAPTRRARRPSPNFHRNLRRLHGHGDNTIGGATPRLGRGGEPHRGR